MSIDGFCHRKGNFLRLNEVVAGWREDLVSYVKEINTSNNNERCVYENFIIIFFSETEY